MPPAVRIKRRDKSSTYQDGTGSCFCPEFGVLVRSSELDLSSNSETELRTPGKNTILYQTATFMEQCGPEPDRSIKSDLIRVHAVCRLHTIYILICSFSCRLYFYVYSCVVVLYLLLCTLLKGGNNTLVNVYVDLVVFTHIAGTLKTGSGRYWR